MLTVMGMEIGRGCSFYCNWSLGSNEMGSKECVLEKEGIGLGKKGRCKGRETGG